MLMFYALTAFAAAFYHFNSVRCFGHLKMLRFVDGNIAMSEKFVLFFVVLALLQNGISAETERRTESGPLQNKTDNSTKANPAPTSHIKCDFIGSLAIKDECVRYLNCSRIGLPPISTPCPGGKYFDHRKRTCMKKFEAQCNSKVVCPEPNGKYPDETNKFGTWYLLCHDGVPFPKICPPGEKFEEERRECTVPKG